MRSVYVIIRSYEDIATLSFERIRFVDIVKIVDSEKKAINYIHDECLKDGRPDRIKPWMNYFYKYMTDNLAQIRYEPHEIE